LHKRVPRGCDAVDDRPGRAGAVEPQGSLDSAPEGSLRGGLMPTRPARIALNPFALSRRLEFLAGLWFRVRSVEN
jgi:hypothetical protein